MWSTLRLVQAKCGLVDPVTELMQTTSRAMIAATAVVYLALQLVVGIGTSDTVSMRIWFLAPILGVTCLLALRLVERHLLVSQLVWHTGLAVMISLALVLFGYPEIALAYAILPFMAVVTVGWAGGLLAEVGVIAILGMLSVLGGARLAPPAYGWTTILAGAMIGFIGWAASRANVTVARWSVASFEEARRNMESARQHRAQLARVVEDLDRAYYRLERTNAALIAAWRTADQMERVGADFATSLSHELRTPLNLIIGFCEMMLTAPQKYGGLQIPGPYRTDLNAVHSSAKHLMAMVNDVLDLARMDAGRFSLLRDEVEARALVGEAVDMVGEYIEAKGLELRIDIAPGIPPLWIDRLRIRQVLLNLLVNAARFTESGSISVNVAQRSDEVVFQVCDTGRGIPSYELPRIFEEFRPEGAPPPATGWPSTGLGLPISKRFVELHGGTMTAESVHLKGTTVQFTVPSATAAEPSALPSALVPPRRMTHLSASKRIVVIVRPDPREAVLLERQLDGYRVLLAADVHEAVSIAQENKALAIITDQEEPPAGLDPTMLWINCPMPGPRATAKALGVADYLVKPVFSDDLWAAIDRLECNVGRVLVADDDPDMHKLLRRILSPRVVARDLLIAHNGAEALALLRAERPDLVLLDLLMPEMDGQAVLAEKAKDTDIARVPVIVISAREEFGEGARSGRALRVLRPNGLEVGELAQSLQALLNVLAPGWQ